MLAPLAPLERLKARLAETIGLLPTNAPRGVASLILELPRPLTLPPELPGDGFGLTRGEREEMHAGYGVAAQWTAAGPERFHDLRAQARALARDWQQCDPDETGFGGFVLFGFAASPNPDRFPDSTPRPNPVPKPVLSPAGPADGPGFPNALLWLPELGLCTRGGQSALVFSTPLPANPDALHTRWCAWLERLDAALAAPLPEPLTPSPLAARGSVPDLGTWRLLVESALAEIDREALEKVVLCRRVTLKGRRPFDPRRLLAALAYLFPSCQTISVRRAGRRIVAATPERLLRLTGRTVEVDALAGTAARSASVATDAALTAALRASDKERREHAMVVEAVCAALDGCCDSVLVPAAPRVMQLHTVQHLWSPITGRLLPGRDLFELARRLHPTPATNGQPRTAAADWLRRREPLDRGWYTGAVGVLEPGPDGDLNGELWVLLRYAEVDTDEARLFAGAGIVPGSDPLSEWRETGHKLAAVAAALRFA